MLNPLSPGVYIEEVPGGARPIAGVATAITAFVGAANKGPAGEANLIGKQDDYSAEYGAIASEDDAMGLAVQAFYMNGGGAAYICRLAGAGSEAASTTVQGQGPVGGPVPVDPVLAINASSVGTWGNDVYIQTVKPDQDSLIFDLLIGHHDKDGEWVEDEEFAGLSMRVDDDNYALSQVNGNSAFVELELDDSTEALYGDADLTGGELPDNATYLRDNITGPMTLTLNINGLGARLITINPEFPVPPPAVTQAADGAIVATAIENAVKTLSTEAPYQNFTCAYAAKRFTLTSPKDDSNATLEVYDGELANSLRLNPKQPATLTGTEMGAGANAVKNAIPAAATIEMEIDGHGKFPVELDPANLDFEGDNAADGKKVALVIQNLINAKDLDIPSYATFTCEYSAARKFVLTSGSSSARVSEISVSNGTLAAALKLQGASDIPGRTVEQGTADVIPLQELGALDRGDKLTGGVLNDPTPQDYNSFYGNILRKVADVSIILLPGENWTEDSFGNPVISHTLAHCERTGSRVLIIDPPDVEFEQAAQINGMGLPTSTYAALYHPWVEVANPFYDEDKNPNASQKLTIAPSAFAAGMWAKTDAKRGVWKAPAGVGAQLNGIAGLSSNVEKLEQDQLNPLGINCIRKLPGYGSVIWGSRTLATKADPPWRYVPVRRTAIFIEQSIYNSIQWAVFEPNDTPLWGALRGSIGAFMNSLFRAGAFQGTKADDAYFVRCGLDDTMTQNDIDSGKVIVIVGFAPLKPAEFVIVRIQQIVGKQ